MTAYEQGQRHRKQGLPIEPIPALTDHCTVADFYRLREEFSAGWRAADAEIAARAPFSAGSRAA
jgi:hypothetical protein